MGDFTNGYIADKQMATLASSNVHGAFLSLFPTHSLFLTQFGDGFTQCSSTKQEGYLSQSNKLLKKTCENK